MVRTRARWTWWRLTLSIVGVLLLLSALVVSAAAPATWTGTTSSSAGGSQTTVLGSDTAFLIWPVALAVIGIGAIVLSLVLPRRGTGAA